jgi:hypothetical protein
LTFFVSPPSSSFVPKTVVGQAIEADEATEMMALISARLSLTDNLQFFCFLSSCNDIGTIPTNIVIAQITAK